MRKTVGITTTNEIGDEVVKIFHLDNEIMDGLYQIQNKHFIKKNLRSFDIKIQKSKGPDNVGIMFSKVETLCIATFHFWNYGPSYPQLMQFLVSSELNQSDILDSDNPHVVKSLKPALLDALDLAKIETLADLMKTRIGNEGEIEKENKTRWTK